LTRRRGGDEQKALEAFLHAAAAATAGGKW